MMKARHIQQHGVRTDAIITSIRTVHSSKGSTDIIGLEYRDIAGNRYPAKTNSSPGKYRTGQRLPLSYLAEKPASYAIGIGNGYWVLLILCVLILLFTIFASYKINEMLQHMH